MQKDDLNSKNIWHLIGIGSSVIFIMTGAFLVEDSNNANPIIKMNPLIVKVIGCFLILIFGSILFYSLKKVVSK